MQCWRGKRENLAKFTAANKEEAELSRSRRNQWENYGQLIVRKQDL